MFWPVNSRIARALCRRIGRPSTWQCLGNLARKSADLAFGNVRLAGRAINIQSFKAPRSANIRPGSQLQNFVTFLE